MQFSRVFSGLLVGIFPESDGDCIKIGIEEIRIRVQGDLRGLVPENPLQRQNVDAGRHRQAGRGVPQIVRRICWTFARFTAPQIRPRVGFGRGRRAPVSSSDQLVRSAGLDVTVLGGV